LTSTDKNATLATATPFFRRHLVMVLAKLIDCRGGVRIAYQK